MYSSDENDRLLPPPSLCQQTQQKIQREKRFVDGIGVVIGIIDSDDVGNNVRVTEYGNRLIYEYNCHGWSDCWQITFFVPQSDFEADLLSKMNIELIDQSQKEESCILPLKKHKASSCLVKKGNARLVKEDGGFKVYKTRYTNPYKTSTKTHWLAVSLSSGTQVILSYKLRLTFSQMRGQ